MRFTLAAALSILALTAGSAMAQMSTDSGYHSGARAGRQVGGSVGNFVGGVTGAAVGTAGGIVNAVTSPLRPRHTGRPHRRHRHY